MFIMKNTIRDLCFVQFEY